MNLNRQPKIYPPKVDKILAYRYAFFVYKKRIISDEKYDAMAGEEIEFGTMDPALLQGKDPRPCPERIKTLALYLVLRYEDWKGGQRNNRGELVTR